MYEDFVNAVKKNDSDTLATLLQNCDQETLHELINIKSMPHGNTLLHMASIEDHHKCVQLLLDYGADTKIVNNDGLTPLHETAFKGNSASTLMLLNKGADTNALYRDSNPAFLAYLQHHYDLLELLIRPETNISKLLQFVLDNKNIELLAVILIKKEKINFSTSEKKKLRTLRNELWNAFSNSWEHEKPALKEKICARILDVSDPLNAIFKNQFMSQSWSDKNYIVEAQKIVAESKNFLQNVENEHIEDTSYEEMHLIPTTQKSYGTC